MIWSTMVTQSHSVPHLMLKISDTGLPQLQVCLTMCNLSQILILSCFTFVDYSPTLTGSCHPPFSMPLIIVSAAPLAVVAQCFLGAMGFVSALWSWHREDLVYACWSALVLNHHARSLSYFFSTGKETLQNPTSFLGGFEYPICMKDCQLAGFRLILTASSTRQT